MKKNKNWTILVYALILSILVSILSLIIINKQSIFIWNLEYTKYDSKLLKNIYNKADIASKDFLLDWTWAYSKINWYIRTDSDFNNIFFVNNQINRFINTSTYNDISKLWNVTSGAIYVYVDNSAKLKFVEFDRNIYNNWGWLKYLTWFTLDINTWTMWYLTPSGLVSSYSRASKYDFSSQNLALFLSYTSSWSTHPENDYLMYYTRVYDNSWNISYMNPIKFEAWLTKYLWYDLLHLNWNYISKFMELIK